jgi:2-polyprenyl-3-methyl-5-hydroxy-6-metoxy-1,4-benzoquinol methylase
MRYKEISDAKPDEAIYDEEYYKERAYDFDLRYPYFNIIAKVLTTNSKPRQVLDVGCAKGYLVYAFRELGVEAYGVDISQYAISQSPESVRGYLQNVDVEFEKLPFEDETFDMVTSLECMEHLQNPSHAVSEMARVLKPGGIAAIGTPKMTIWRIIFNLVFGRSAVHPSELSKSSWVRIFEAQSFVYLGDFIAQEPREVSRDLRSINKKMTYPMSPGLKIGEYLNKLGRPGKWLRVQLNLIAWQSEKFLFKLQK